LDYESRSEKNLAEVGLDVYATHHSTEVILGAYCYDDGPVKLWEPHLCSSIPPELEDGLLDDRVNKWSFNAQFERVITQWILGIEVPINQWRCAMVQARYLSLPGSLEECGEKLGLPPDLAKMEEGKRLIKKFCLPAKEGGEETLFGISEAIFRDWESDPEDWKLFGSYCIQDVVAERAIINRMAKFPLPLQEWELYQLDQKINDFGIPCDMLLVNNAADFAERIHDGLAIQHKNITGLDNPNSRNQLLNWARANGYPFSTLNKSFVNLALNGNYSLTGECRTALKIRQQSAKTFDSKFGTIKDMVGSDGRLRYSFKFMGASRTARWSGHGVQPQNLTRPNKELEKRVDEAIEIIRAGDFNRLISSFKSDPLDVLAGCLRSSFRAGDDEKLVICDESAIETRVGAWLADCKPLLQVFADGKDAYLAFACELYDRKYEDLEILLKTKDPAVKEMRQNAKPAILGAIFRLGGGDEITTETGDKIRTGLWGYAQNLGVEMTKELAHKSVELFREKYHEIVQLWYDLENASIKCVETGKPQQVRFLRFELLDDVLKMILPSRRSVHYLNPTVEEREWFGKTKKTLVYWGNDLKQHTYSRIPTHGGKLLENADQAISRDILSVGVLRADKIGFPIFLHAHDEIAAVVKKTSHLGVKELRECMRQSIDWAPGLPLDAAGFECVSYRKE
jgi:DNA polymerase